LGAKQFWLASDHQGDTACCATYTCGAILEDLALGLRVVQSRLGDRFLDCRGDHCCATSCNQGRSREMRWEIKVTGDEGSQRNVGWEEEGGSCLETKKERGAWVRHELMRRPSSSLAVSQWRGRQPPTLRSWTWQ
jgi:hypothetical protein